MTIFGVDVSGYQGNFDFPRCRAQGYDFAVIKATEGGNYVNPSYAAQLQSSVNSGLLTSSYHFVHAADIPGQLAELERYVDKRYPVWLDSEVDGAGEYNASVQLHDQARRDGWSVVGVYFPRWFWSSIGSPNLAPLGALWSSGYPTTRTGAAADIYAAAGGDNGSGWAPYGGATPGLWQFTNAAAVANYSRVDADAFRGTRDQLAALLQGDDMPTAQEIAQAILDFPVAQEGGRNVTLSFLLQDIGRDALDKIAQRTLDFPLNPAKDTISLAAQTIRNGTAKVQATVTVDQEQLAAAVAAAMANVAPALNAETVKQIVDSAFASLTLKTADPSTT